MVEDRIVIGENGMEHIIENSAYADWKAESEDIVFVLRDSYSELYPALADEALDELAENYAAEEPEDFLKALGQELTALGLALYDVAEDSDDYRLMVVPLAQAADFKAVLKSQKLKGTLRKQPRRKEGMPAKRIDLGQRMPCEKAAWPKGGIRAHEEVYEDKLWLDKHGEREIYSGFLDLRQWPPVLTEKKEIVVRRIAEREDGLMAVIAMHSEVNERGYLAELDRFILVGRDLNDMWSWKCLWQEKSPEWNALQWYQDDLFVVSGGLCVQAKVFRIKGAGKEAAKSVGQPELLIETPPAKVRDGIFPKLFIAGGKPYLFLQTKLYEWKPDGFFRKGSFAKVIATIDNEFVNGFIPVCETKVAFLTGTQSGRYRDSATRTLHVLDLISGAQQTYPCYDGCGYLHKWKDNRVCVCFFSDDNARKPMMECFDLNTGERKVLMYGALGRERVNTIYETAAGTVLEGDRGSLYRAKWLWEFMETDAY